MPPKPKGNGKGLAKPRTELTAKKAGQDDNSIKKRVVKAEQKVVKS